MVRTLTRLYIAKGEAVLTAAVRKGLITEQQKADIMASL